MKPVKAIIYNVGQEPQVVTMEMSLEAMKTIVGGYIEMASLGYGLALICNEEGHRLGLPVNRTINLNGQPILGNFFITRIDDEGECTDLTETDIAKFLV